jgi:LPS sulfotransferase NodH
MVGKSMRVARFIQDSDLYPDVSHHRDAIEAQFIIDRANCSNALASLAEEKDIVFVCFSNRSGSNLLLDALGRVGFGCEAGDEFFNAEAIVDHVNEFQFTKFEQYLEFVLTIRGFRDCVFLKIGPHQLFWLANSGLLEKYFAHARYVLIERGDQIAQAVSLYLAEATGVYIMPTEGGGRTPPDDVVYSETEILKCLKHISDVSALFRYFFALHSLPYHQMRYEDIAKDAIGTLRAMASALEIEDRFPKSWELALGAQAPRIVRQSNALNDSLVAQFKQQFKISRKLCPEI